jgi:hypothetical protein
MMERNTLPLIPLDFPAGQPQPPLLGHDHLGLDHLKTTLVVTIGELLWGWPTFITLGPQLVGTLVHQRLLAMIDLAPSRVT